MNPDEIFNFVARPISLVFFSLVALGVVLKNSSHVDDWKIPFILGAFGFALGAFFLSDGLDAKDFQDLGKRIGAGGMIGVIFSAVTVYGHQILAQWGNRKHGDDGDRKSSIRPVKKEDE